MGVGFVSVPGDGLGNDFKKPYAPASRRRPRSGRACAALTGGPLRRTLTMRLGRPVSMDRVEGSIWDGSQSWPRWLGVRTFAVEMTSGPERLGGFTGP
jgi:hypothetical protein